MQRHWRNRPTPTKRHVALTPAAVLGVLVRMQAAAVVAPDHLHNDSPTVHSVTVQIEPVLNQPSGPQAAREGRVGGGEGSVATGGNAQEQDYVVLEDIPGFVVVVVVVVVVVWNGLS
jgi:hypothetical protein